LLFTLIVVTGAVLWWPGRGRWLSSLFVVGKTSRRRLLWRLHSAVGFWSVGILLLWGLTAVYFAFPGLFEATIDYFDSNPNDFERPGERLLLTMISGHFGRFGGMPIRITWVLLGLIPIALFVSGFNLWLGPRRRSNSSR
jgi:uncharacterized iron-regulated membrane protein